MRVAVLGAGYAGLALARRLESRLPDDVALVVVDDTGEHLVQHELHRVIRRPSLAEDLTVPLSEALSRASVRTDRVTNVDPDAGVAELADGGEVDYDFGAVCLGAETDFHDLPGVEEHGTPLKRVAHAERVRADFLPLLDDGGTVVVGGAGLSGVQVAGELAALARESGAAVGPDGDVTVRLLERLDAVAPGFPDAFGAAVREALEARGVAVRTGAPVAEATDDAVVVDGGETVAYDQFVWTGGIRGPAAFGGERPRVRATMRLGDGTFVLGDAARVVDAAGEAVPASAQAAIREGRVVAENVARLVAHERDGDGVFDPRLTPLSFEAKGWLVSVGDGAVGLVGGRVVTGRAAKALKATVGAGYLTSVGAVRNAVDLVGVEFGYGG